MHTHKYQLSIRAEVRYNFSDNCEPVVDNCLSIIEGPDQVVLCEYRLPDLAVAIHIAVHKGPLA